MQLFGVRGTIGFVLVAVVMGVLAALGIDLAIALVGGVVGGTLLTLALFRIPAVDAAADRAEHWLATPK